MRTLCAALLSVCLPTVALAAELVVLESTSPTYQVANILDADKNIVLEENTQILLIAEDGTIISLAGPYSGLPRGDAASGAPGVLDVLRQIVGYAEAETADIGGVRGDAGGDDFMTRQVDDHRTSPWLLHVAITGRQCVRAGVTTPEYWREQSDTGERLTVKRVATGETATVVWKAGANTAAWPDAFPLRADEMYLLRLGDQLRSTNLLLREIPAPTGDDGRATVAFLAAKGCFLQARMELARLG